VEYVRLVIYSFLDETSNPEAKLNNVILIIVALIFLGLGLFPIINPQAAAHITAQYFAWNMRLFGYECEIRATPRAAKILRVWNLAMLILMLAFILSMTSTLK